MQINRCPKCGREPKMIKYVMAGDELECYSCGLRTGVCFNFDEAVTKWNALTETRNG
jgi:hypothetical protein